MSFLLWRKVQGQLNPFVPDFRKVLCQPGNQACNQWEKFKNPVKDSISK